MLRIFFIVLIQTISVGVIAQQRWINVDSNFSPLPKKMHVFKCTDSLEGKSFLAFYITTPLKNKKIKYTTDTAYNRRLTPMAFYLKNDKPVVVVNGTFFSFTSNKNLNTVIRNGKLLAYNIHSIAGKQKDTLTYKHIFGSAIGISKKRKADVAWLYADSSKINAYALQQNPLTIKDSSNKFEYESANKNTTIVDLYNGVKYKQLKKWKMQTAIGGGPVLIQNGQIKITNNEELKFVGKAIYDKHPRTCMGYTNDGQLIILVIQGRSANAAGASLIQAANLLKDIGCLEALNLDGGGSSCMLINGKETIIPSDKEGERAVPAVFIVK